MARIWLIAGIALLAGCTTTTTPPGTPSSSAACEAASAQAKIGQTASEALGAELLHITGARTLRWLAPGMAATMDFRPDRLSVAYDDKMVITRLSCG
ncbi:MAG TPA: I78 family peptidase inhibitor [Sphingobium sp.]|uniref:I78 family peptidase inhibitor n=1 Tax=Sphingobium sp. TaxID=1912891 RepID=UPI002ED6AC45